MIAGTSRHLRLAAGVAALLFLATGCAAAGGEAAPKSTPTPAATAGPHASAAPSAPPAAPQPPEVALAMAESAPVHLSIPKLGVESDLIYTGLRGDGTLDVPPGDEGSPASWYDGSPTPGSAGPAILLGHVNSLTDASGVFHLLRDLVPGDRMSVARDDGSVATFEVYRNENYVKAEFPTKDVYYPVPGAELRLITCDGYVKDARRYDNNRVVFAKLVETA
ncbi:MAG: class sortase [Naasia sp.]|nr:class sortase [Naasia sp.]